MVLGNFFSSPRRGLSLENALKHINEQLENARKSNNTTRKSQLCKNVKSKLKEAENIFTATMASHPTQDDGIATAYHEHALLLDILGHHDKANKSYKKAKVWGYAHVTNQQAGSSRPSNNANSIHRSLCPTAALIVVPAIIISRHPNILNLDISQPIIPSPSQSVVPAITDNNPEANVDTVTIPYKIFHQDVILSRAKYTLPEDTRRITSTPQLAYCLSLSLPSLVPKEGFKEIEPEGSQDKVNNPYEQDRLQTMATGMVREFIRDELKTPDIVAEVVCLSAVLDKVVFRKLLQAFVDGIEQSVLLEFHLLDGLAHLIGNATPGRIDADDLVKILELLNTRLNRAHSQSTRHIYLLAQTVSRVLDSMVVSHVKYLKREQLHEALSSYLIELQRDADPRLVYQAAYAHQALQYIPDDETTLQAAFRRTGKIFQGISGVISAVKALDLNGLIQGLQNIHEELAAAGNAIVRASNTYQYANELGESGQNLLESLQESLSLGRKRAWYPALRGLDLLVQEGRFVEFEKLIREAPCRQDPAFQIGVCQRLGDLAINPLWDTDTRHCAISFLGEMYRDDVTWGQQADVKEWIIFTLIQLGHSSDDMITSCAEKQLRQLEVDGSLLQVDTKEYSNSYPILTALQFQTSPLLDRVLNKPDVELGIQQLRNERMKERGGDVYISPRAKASQASEADFDLTTKTQEFLASNKKKVLLILGDSGAGKSTFNRALEVSLWEEYKKNGRIPIFIHLPTIDKPEQDLVTKHLYKLNFTDSQIRELKLHRELILICDGYDESQQIRNLYMSNQLNQTGGWQAQMVISCRTEYTGVDYKDLFQPTDRNDRSLGLMEEILITPFNKNQIQDYINKYVSIKNPPWESKDYIQALKEIPNLQDLVRNPFLLKLALEVLPSLVTTKIDFSTKRITHIELYDEFVTQWIDRSRIRLGDMDLSVEDKKAFKELSNSGFKQHGITYLKELAAAIYDNQDGFPIVKYSAYHDQGTWKAAFFNNTNGNNLLQEAIPLVRNSNQYRFIHKSVLEYGLALAIYDPHDQAEDANPIPAPSRRGSASSTESFEVSKPNEETSTAIEQSLLESPLGKRSLVNEPSILQFLVERVQQQPLLKDQLHAIIELSKRDKSARIAAANSITVLVQAGVQFIGADLRGIQIPGADLSYGVFDSARLEGADLRKTNLRNVWLREANLSGAHMGGVQFGELPYLQEDRVVKICAYSPNGKTFAVGLEIGEIRLYDTTDWSWLQSLEGHSDNEEVTCLMYSQTGDRIASGIEKTVWLWDVETGDCIHTFEGHGGTVWSVVYSPKGDRIASGSEDRAVRLWDVETGNCVHTLQGHDNRARSVVYSPKGDQIASGSEDNAVRLWDVETGNCVHTLQGHDDRVYNVVYSPKGDQIASGSVDETVRLWNVETGNCVHTLRGHGGIVRCVDYSPKGDQIASGGDDGAVRLWDVKTGNGVHTLQEHGEALRSVIYSPKGDHIISSSVSTIRLWDVETGNCVQTLQGHDEDVTSVVYSPKGDQIAAGSEGGIVRLWDTETGNRVITLQGRNECVWSVVYSPKGNQIASGSGGSIVRLWDVETGDCVHALQGHDDTVESVVYSPKGDQIASGSRDSTIRLWDVGTGSCVHTLQGHGGSVRSVDYSPKGDQIASGSEGGIVRLWDVETGNCVHTLQGHDASVLSVVYSPKGDHIASGSADETVRLWNVETGNCVHTLQGHGGFVRSVDYSPKGDQITSGSRDGTVRLWDVETGNCIRTLQGHDDFVLGVVYPPKGDQIASGNFDKTVRLWDVGSVYRVHTLQGHDGSVLSVIYPPKGDQIASGNFDKTARLWDVGSVYRVHTLQGHDGSVLSVVYSPKGDQIASRGEDETVRLWDVETGNCVHILLGHENIVSSIVYSPKGGQVASGSWDRTARLWDVQTGECLILIQGFGGAVESISWKNTFDCQHIVTGCQVGSIQQWRIIKEGDGYKALLSWSSSHGVLAVNGASFDDAQGLSMVNWELLCQRGALDSPTIHPVKDSHS